jgi:predicted nucleotidyltransferase
MGFLERYDELLDQLPAGLQAHYGERLVACAVFGSVGRGTPRSDSDVDLLIVARDLPRGRLGRVDEFLTVEAHLAPILSGRGSGEGGPRDTIVLSPIFKTPAEVEAGSPLFLDMVDDARILHDPDAFLARYLARLRARLRALCARRVWRGNAWYWDLKPDYRRGEVFEL